MNEPENKLTIAGGRENIIQAGNTELGQRIHDQAIDRAKQTREDRVIAEIQRLEECRLDYTQKAVFATNAANWYQKKITAVKAGEFDVNLVHGALIFRDPDLQRANY